MSKDPKNILIVKLCCLGDIIYSIPLIKTIKVNSPDAKITYVIADWCKDLIELIPEVDNYILFNAPYEKSNFVKKIYSILKLIINLRHNEFDAGLNLHRNSFFSFLFFISGIKKRIGFGDSRFLTVKVPYSSDLHESKKFLSLLKNFDFHNICNFPTVKILEAEIENTNLLLQKYHISPDDQLVAFYPDGGKNPGSLMEIRQLNPAKYNDFIKHLLNNYGIKIILIDSKESGGNAVKIHKEINDFERCLLIPNLDIKKIAALEKRCLVVIGGDTGILHLAAAVGTPVIMFYGPDDPNQWAPPGSQHQLIWHKIECAPCYTPNSVQDKHNFKGKTFICKRGDVLCMESIMVNEMMEAFDKVYKNKRNIS